MRILQAAPCVAAQSGGPAVVIEVTTAMLRGGGHDVTVATTDQLTTAAERRSARNDYRIFRSIGGDRVAFAPRFLAWTLRHVRTFDLVHVHGYQQPVSLWTVAVCVLARVPFTLSPHGTLGSYELAKGRRAKSVAVRALRVLLKVSPPHRVVCTTEAERADLPTWATPSAVSPIPVEPPPPPPPESLPAPPPSFVLHLGRVADKKGLERTARLLAATPLDIDFVVAGDVASDESDRIRTEVCSILGNRVHFVGHVDGARKADLVRNAECLALLSDDENFAVAVAEALVVGTPVLVSERVALSAAVRDLAGGVVVAGNGERATTSDLLGVLEARDRSRLAADAEEYFAPNRVLQGLECIYNELVHGRS